MTEKRRYTMSEKAVQQRRAAQPAATEASRDASTGPRTEEGKAASSRNAWKHGRYSAVHRHQFGTGAMHISKLFGKPCRTTCPFHPENPERTEAPCSLVLDGLTRAGGPCLDKTVYVQALGAVMDVLQNGDMDGMNGLFATELASNLELLRAIRESIAEQGIVIEIPMVTKDGTVPLNPTTGKPYIAEAKANPVLAHLIRFVEALGISFPEMTATPRARRGMEAEEETASGLAGILGAIASRARSNLPAPRPALPHDEEGDA